MGAGGAMIAILVAQQAAKHESPCKKNNCRCPCHNIPSPWWVTPVDFCGLFLIALGFLWFVITIATWFDTYPEAKTLVQILKDQWHWFWDLLHRIW